MCPQGLHTLANWSTILYNFRLQQKKLYLLESDLSIQQGYVKYNWEVAKTS